MPNYLVAYKLYGAMYVEADSPEEAEEKMINEDDREILDGLSRVGPSLDANSIEVYQTSVTDDDEED